MPLLLKIMIPYVVAVLGAVVIFAAGAYAATWLPGESLLLGSVYRRWRS